MIVMPEYYAPIQPRFLLEGDSYKERRNIWGIKESSEVLFFNFRTPKNGETGRLPVFPDGCLDLILKCDPVNPALFIYGKLTEYKSDVFDEDTEYFGVRLMPDQNLKGLTCTMKDLLNQNMPLSNYVKLDGELLLKLAQKPSFEERITFFQERISPLLPLEQPQPVMMVCTRKIMEQKGNLNLLVLSDITGYSDRYIRKKFTAEMGLSPKNFCRIIRFQNSLNTLLTGFYEKDKILNAVYDNGYYDEAHFINEFRQFTSFTPGFLVKSCLNIQTASCQSL